MPKFKPLVITKHPIQVVPVITLDYMSFEDLVGGNPPLATVAWLEALRKRVKKATGYFWDNPNFRYSSIVGNEFAFQVYAQPNGIGSFNLWDATGSRYSIGQWILSAADVGLRMGAVKTAMNLADQFSRGLIRCVNCKELICTTPMAGYNSVAGTIYTGVYCSECWNLPIIQQEKAMEGI